MSTAVSLVVGYACEWCDDIKRCQLKHFGVVC